MIIQSIMITQVTVMFHDNYKVDDISDNDDVMKFMKITI